jgi:hypothetical protein
MEVFMNGLFDLAVQLFCITALFALFVFFLAIITDLAYDLAGSGGEPRTASGGAASSATRPGGRDLPAGTTRHDTPR